MELWLTEELTLPKLTPKAETTGVAPGGVYNWVMDPFRVVRQSWQPGDSREVEVSRIDRQIGVEYDSYRKVYLADGHEWIIAGQIARDDGKKYYLLECIS
jgi:hypothetical protein